MLSCLEAKIDNTIPTLNDNKYITNISEIETFDHSQKLKIFDHLRIAPKLVYEV